MSLRAPQVSSRKKLAARDYMTAIKEQIKLLSLQNRQTIYQTDKTSRKMDKLKLLQWNCRRLSNKTSDLILFPAEEVLDVFRLNEAKNWKKRNPLNNYIVTTETCNNGHHGFAILVNNSPVIKRTEPVEIETDTNRRTLKQLKNCPNLPSIDDLWIIANYNSPGKPLSAEKLSSGKLKKVFACGDFNAPHRTKLVL